MQNPAMITGEYIRLVREQLGESQQEFARRIGVHQTTLHRWETRGLPSKGVTARHVSQVICSLAKGDACNADGAMAG